MREIAPNQRDVISAVEASGRFVMRTTMPIGDPPEVGPTYDWDEMWALRNYIGELRLAMINAGIIQQP